MDPSGFEPEAPRCFDFLFDETFSKSFLQSGCSTRLSYGPARECVKSVSSKGVIEKK